MMVFHLNKFFPSEEDQQNVDFMSAKASALHRYPPRKVSFLMISVVAFWVIFLIWAHFAPLDEIARGEGKIIPSSSVQKISNLEGGIIQKILVKEGQIVQKNQVLMRIDPTIAEARLKEGKESYYRYLAEVERLKALSEGKEFTIPDEVQKNAPQMARESWERYQARRERLLNEVNIADKELIQKQQELQELEAREQDLEKSVLLAQQELGIQKPLADRGLAAKIDVLKIERDLNEVQGRLNSTRINMQKARTAVTQAQEKVKQIPVIFQNEDYNELKDASHKLAQAQGLFVSQGNITSRTEVRSPVKGVVKQILLPTLGGVIRPGEDIMEIVPLNDTLLVEVNVKPSDIAFLYPGQPAMVKITAYDYSIYGGLEAELVDISPDTVVDEQDPRKTSYYKVKLRTTNLKFTKSQEEKALIPGMVASADIKTGKKTVMNYLLDRIVKVKENALTER